MGRTVLIIVLSFLLLPVCYAGRDTVLRVTPEKIIPGSYNSFYADNLGEVFLLSKTNQVKKLDAHLDSEAVFNDVRRYGNLYSLDVSNPLKIIAYFRDFTTILVLDRFLKTINTVDLRKYDILQSRAVAVSYDNNYWVFDDLDNVIKKIDDNGNVLFRSSDFRVLFDDTFSPSFMKDDNGRLYLFDETKGWLVFDYYGTFRQHIDMTGRQAVGITGNRLITCDSGSLYYYDMQSFTETKVTVPGIDLGHALKVQLALNRIFVLTKDNLSVYSINK